jgi:hypothetical protein
MLARITLTVLVLAVVVGTTVAQSPPAGSAVRTDMQWRSIGDKTSGAAPTTAVTTPAPAEPAKKPDQQATAGSDLKPVTSESFNGATLPRDAGQVWREYDISEYTLRVTSTQRPEQAIVDWILRETGYEAWHGEPLGILSCGPRKLRVYHTPAMQDVVAGIVDRFVGSQAESRAFGLRVVSVDQPNWRVKAQSLLRPVSVQTAGVQAWVLQKEGAAVLLADLRRRGDCREHGSPYLLVNNGQTTVVASTRARPYVRDVAIRADVAPGYQAENGQIDEGFSLEFCPLLSLDGATIDATVKCSITQVEKMVAVALDVPTAAAPRQRATLEVPQTSQFRFHERFRWPTDQVLLISMGMVAMPTPTGVASATVFPLSLASSPARADLLVFVESRPKTAQAAQTPQTAAREAKSYHGRY